MRHAIIDDGLRAHLRRRTGLLGAALLFGSSLFGSACQTGSTPSSATSTSSAATPITPTTTVATTKAVDITIHYGDGESQFGRLRVPAVRVTRRPVIVLIHGGFWRDEYGLDLMDPLADDLDRRGYATWNIEYRRVGEPGGGYPGTLLDVSSAIDHLVKLPDMYGLDVSKVVFVGHSSGGHLALWAAGRGSLAGGRPGAEPRVVPVLSIGLGPVADLRNADAEFLGDDAVAQFLGGHASEYPDRYAVATPSWAPGPRLVVVRAADDDIVPARFTEPDSASAVERIDTSGDHFALIDPTSRAWSDVITRLEQLVPAVT